LLNLKEKVPFDFLIDNEFLRASLKQWRKQQLGERSVVVIEYVKALVAPQEHHDSKHLDWVKCIANMGDITVTGSFDSSLRVFDGTYKQVYVVEEALGGREIWDVKWGQNNTLICGGKNCQAKIFEWNNGRLNGLESFSIPVSVTGVALSAEDKCVLSGQNGGLYFFDVEGKNTEIEQEEKSSKRHRAEVPINSEAALSLSAHREAVTALEWKEQGRVMTASIDKSIKIFDIDSGKSSFCFLC
jgi:WD40 repeat protein